MGNKKNKIQKPRSGGNAPTTGSGFHKLIKDKRPGQKLRKEIDDDK